MELIEGVALSKLCDYSFGDQSGKFDKIFSSFTKDANLNNIEFRNNIFEIKKKRSYMTLFIDNIRLYKRNIVNLKPQDRTYVNSLIKKNDLLELCSYYPEMKFIIFTNLEDTPIDQYIHQSIPENVICIYAVNAIAFGDKVVPAFYGLKRKLFAEDNKIEDLKKFMKKKIEPLQKLYINHNENTHKERLGIKNLFKNKTWATVERKRIKFDIFLKNISLHKFVICPRGNAIDCHRNLEVIYLRRVPVMINNDYLMRLYNDLPVLWIKSFSDVNEHLLDKNRYLYEEAQRLDLSDYSLPIYFNNMVKNALKTI